MMKQFFKIIQRSHSGMSLIDSIVSIGLVGIVTMVGMKQSEFMERSKLDSKIDRDIAFFHNEIKLLFQDVRYCQENFENKLLSHNYDHIVSSDGVTKIYEEGLSYIKGDIPTAPGRVKILNISTIQLNTKLFLDIEIEKRQAKTKTKKTNLKIEILADVDSSNYIRDCFSLTQSSSFTVQYLVAKNLCEQTYGSNTPEFTAHFNGPQATCTIDGVNTFDPPPALPTTCPNGSALTGFDITTGLLTSECSPPFTHLACPGGWVQTLNQAGQFTCLNLSSIVEVSNINFQAGEECGLQADTVSNKIKLVCNPLTIPGNCADLPIGNQCGDGQINGLIYSGCNPVYCGGLSTGDGDACVADAAACTTLGGVSL